MKVFLTDLNDFSIVTRVEGRGIPNCQLQSPEVRLPLDADIILPQDRLDVLDVLPLDTMSSCDDPGTGDERSATVEFVVPAASPYILVRSSSQEVFS